MQLVKIRHVRCGEMDYENVTLVWAWDDWNAAKINEAVALAKAALKKDTTAYYESLKENPVNDPGHSPNYTKYPDMTVKDIKEQWEIARSLYNAWRVRQDKGRKMFSSYLVAEGFFAFWDYEPDNTIEIDWGHAHGIDLKYAEGSDSANDIRAEDLVPWIEFDAG